MKDLKHLYYLENILLEANNELVKKGQEDGKIAVGSVCFSIPEPLINLPGCFSVRLRAPRTGSIEMGTYYMTSMLCEGCRAILERAIEGGYEFLDCLITADTCAQLNRCVENIDKLSLCNKEKFFVTYADSPMKADDTALAHYVRQMKQYVLEPLNKVYGIDISDASIRAAVNQQNEISKLLMEISEFRKEANPKITGYEFSVLCLATYCCPKDLLIDILKETLDEIKTRKTDEKIPYRVRVVLAGSEIDDPGMIKLIEESGAMVVADRFCFGAFPGRQEIILNDNEDALTQVCRYYMNISQCPRYMNTDKITDRHNYMDKLAKEYKADGLIYQQIKFCDYWGYERAFASHVMREEFDYPVLSVDRPYVVGGSGQLRTRVQAFVESIEIKKKQKEK